MRRGCRDKAVNGTCIAGGTEGAATCGVCSARTNLQRFVAAWMKTHRQPLKIVAQQIGVAESTLSQWAHGHRFPKPEQLDALARCANVATGCLFCPALVKTYEEDARDRTAD